MGVLVAGRHRLDLSRPLVMGVVNITPDSFSDGGKFFDKHAALAHAGQLINQGADILDVGGESTRPGAAPVPEEEELRRILPVVETFRDFPVSVDTRRTAVMKAAIGAGASMINDIEALQAPGAIEAVAKSQCAVCLMHMQGQPATMQKDPHYDDVVGEVLSFLKSRAEKAVQAGIARERVVVDPGFGFGKTPGHNFELLRSLGRIGELGLPVLAGWSRKSTLGKLTGRPADERLAASLAAALLALQGGATILRVHDVKETRDVIAVWEAYKENATG